MTMCLPKAFFLLRCSQNTPFKFIITGALNVVIEARNIKMFLIKHKQLEDLEETGITSQTSTADFQKRFGLAHPSYVSHGVKRRRAGTDVPSSALS